MAADNRMPVTRVARAGKISVVSRKEAAAKKIAAATKRVRARKK